MVFDFECASSYLSCDQSNTLRKWLYGYTYNGHALETYMCKAQVYSSSGGEDRVLPILALKRVVTHSF